MNERILELAIDARKYAESKPDIYQVAYDKKFAELIVKECSAYVEGTGNWLVAMEMKQYFGVEE